MQMVEHTDSQGDVPGSIPGASKQINFFNYKRKLYKPTEWVVLTLFSPVQNSKTENKIAKILF